MTSEPGIVIQHIDMAVEVQHTAVIHGLALLGQKTLQKVLGVGVLPLGEVLMVVLGIGPLTDLETPMAQTPEVIRSTTISS